MKKREKTYTGNPDKPAQIKATAPEIDYAMRDIQRVSRQDKEKAKSNAKQRIEAAITGSRAKPTVGIDIAGGNGGYFYATKKQSVQDKKKNRVR